MALGLMWSGLYASANARVEPEWEPFDYFVGKWKSEQSGGDHAPTIVEYRRILNGRYLFATNLPDASLGEATAGDETHDYSRFISYDPSTSRFLLRVFYNNGDVNRYRLGIESDIDSTTLPTFVFDSVTIESLPLGWRARWTLRVDSEDRFSEFTELAEPGEAFETVQQNQWSRVSTDNPDGLQGVNTRNHPETLRPNQSPIITAASPRPNCPTTLTTKAPIRPISTRRKLSNPNVEKVVKPPRRPMTANRRIRSPSPRAAVHPRSTPMRRQPDTLTTNVFHGKSADNTPLAIFSPTQYRRIEPQNPPSPTSNRRVNIAAVLSSLRVASRIRPGNELGRFEQHTSTNHRGDRGQMTDVASRIARQDYEVG